MTPVKDQKIRELLSEIQAILGPVKEPDKDSEGMEAREIMEIPKGYLLYTAQRSDGSKVAGVRLGYRQPNGVIQRVDPHDIFNREK